ncbi:hypothetical protein BDK51DRAFT_34048, partial [Blyttiomyces helicus]
ALIVNSSGNLELVKVQLLDTLRGLKATRENFFKKAEVMEAEFGRTEKKWDEKLRVKLARLSEVEDAYRTLKQRYEKQSAKLAKYHADLKHVEAALREAETRARDAEVERRAIEARLREAEDHVRLIGDEAERRVGEVLADRRALEKQLDASRRKTDQLEGWRRSHSTAALSASNVPDDRRHLQKINHSLTEDMKQKNLYLEERELELRNAKVSVVSYDYSLGVVFAQYLEIASAYDKLGKENEKLEAQLKAAMRKLSDFTDRQGPLEMAMYKESSDAVDPYLRRSRAGSTVRVLDANLSADADADAEMDVGRAESMPSRDGSRSSSPMLAIAGAPRASRVHRVPAAGEPRWRTVSGSMK